MRLEAKPHFKWRIFDIPKKHFDHYWNEVPNQPSHEKKVPADGIECLSIVHHQEGSRTLGGISVINKGLYVV